MADDGAAAGAGAAPDADSLRAELATLKEQVRAAKKVKGADVKALVDEMKRKAAQLHELTGGAVEKWDVPVKELSEVLTSR